ncbi:MAG: PspC domain-containing protein [Candidatus Saccharibacteria bacterium]
MNEVVRIHLGRQPFMIAVGAHQTLKTYLAAIHKQVGDQEVVDEVELRMAELLGERGVTGDKVILMADVDFLTHQLGEPAAFKDDSADALPSPAGDKPHKQLFRDTDNALIAGVAAGLASYFGIDVLLIRILFIVAVLSGGWGILIYIALWLLVPPATSPRDRLRMQGMSVTVESLKHLVERADVGATARRANRTLVPPINRLFVLTIKLLGVGFILGGLAVLFGLLAIVSYMALHSGQLFQDSLFPVGTTEHLLVNLSLGLAALVALFVVLVGLATYKRRWPIRSWLTGVFVGLFFIGLAGCIALTADVAPQVRDRYNAASKTVIRTVEPFQTVSVQNGSLDYRYDYANNYSVTFHYLDNPVIANIKTVVKNGTLEIDSSRFDGQKKCPMLCLFPRYNLTVTVRGPTLPQHTYPDNYLNDLPETPQPPIKPAQTPLPPN